MKNFMLYPRLAVISMSKNKKTYVPFILTCIGMVMMFYIISFLSMNEDVMNMPGGRTMSSMLTLGQVVMAVFSVIFLFYTNSFLIRRRKKEFGLYNILGMGKWNLARILTWETLIIAVISLAAGLACGILFSKLAQMVMAKLLSSTAGFAFPIEPKAILFSVALFTGIFLLILVSSLLRIHISNPIELVKSEAVGEKAPKANWVLALAGIILIGAAYYLAITIQNPIAAIYAFFIAVIMVILGTYLLFISGSVAFCRLLQKNKRYYYRTNHFVSVSSMVYRMKHNGASLASICILATMVLVMMTSTICLYIGKEENLMRQYPRDICVDAYVAGDDDFSFFDEAIEQTLTEFGLEAQNGFSYRYQGLAGYLDGDRIYVDHSSIYAYDMVTYQNVYQFYFVPAEDYNSMTGEKISLSSDEVALYCTGGLEYPYDTITLEYGGVFRVKEVYANYINNNLDSIDAIETIYVLVDSFDMLEGVNEWHWEKFNGPMQVNRYTAFDLDTDESVEPVFAEQLEGTLRGIFIAMAEESEDDRIMGCSVNSREGEKDFWYSQFGGLMFLGALLSIVFVFASVLMIYYKQITEGYEDHDRFVILQKVGMTEAEVKKTINSQVLTVFFLPLLAAGIHLAAAFNIVFKLLQLFSLTNLKLFIAVNVGCFLVFAVLYVAVYLITSRAYYHIVK